MSSTSAVLIGDGSLLVRCAQTWLEEGHAIACIASGNAEILSWAASQGIPSSRIEGRDAIGIPESDYIFSIANLRVLPPEVVGRARRCAINFHDGPLPRYAGLHATAWALMAGEPAHGITWHEITDKVDAGRIARQVTFPLAADETSLSLNARCYEAAVSSFRELARAAASDTLAFTPQAGERTWFGRDRRPALLGTLDFGRPADELARVVRALDFGHSPNPLARAKIWTGREVLVARTAAVFPTSAPASPGAVLASHEGALRVATPAGELHLDGITDLQGRPASLPQPGAVLPPLDGALRDRLAQAALGVARAERLALDALAGPAMADLPFPALTAAPDHEAHRFPLHARPDETATLAGFAAWLAAVSASGHAVVACADPRIASDARKLPGWLSEWTPLSLRFAADAAVAEIQGQAAAALAAARAAGPVPADLAVRQGERKTPAPRFALDLGVHAEAGPFELLLVRAEDGSLQLAVDARYAEPVARTIAAQLDAWLTAFPAAAGASNTLRDLPLMAPGEAAEIERLNDTACAFDAQRCVHEAIAAQAARTPGAVALECAGTRLTYAELERRAASLASLLRSRGAGDGTVVGLCLPRSAELVVAMLAAWKTGAAYLPLDPDYPADRIAFMLQDSRAGLVLTDSTLAAALRLPPERLVLLDAARADAAPAEQHAPEAAGDSGRAAYMIYTSGSTGQPKGVVVTHRNVMNFFAGMDARIPHEPPGRWLAVTSLSFDISVLELAWTLARGFTVVLHSRTVRDDRPAPEFSLFYFASDHASEARDRYRLLMEGAKFADANGFSAVWTPERHFHAFGGLYPNPAVTSAAIAAATQRIKIRAGSCVLPLHHPLRVAEEWAFVDNISQGRVGISFASGWQPNDFVLAPQAFADRKNLMLSGIDTVRRLWRGERMAFPGPQGKPVEVQTLPRPVQPELPVWLTAAGNPETFEQAGANGCHLLTHLLGQKVEDVAEKIRLYHAAWRKAGHPGRGQVTLMLHTFVGDDEEQVRETVRGPMKAYLSSSVDLIRQAAWSFPTFVQRGAEDGKSPVEIMESAPLSDDEMDALLEHAFERYYGTSALFGTPERCVEMVERLRAAGVDEIACLIDFGIPTDTVLAHLQHLRSLMETAKGLRPAERRVSVAQQVAAHAVTHLQCTPSMAAMLVADAEGREALGRLQVLMAGGEALPPSLAGQLRALVPGRVLNMYGPTETTIWSTTCELDGSTSFVPLGRPIANTQLRVRNPWGLDCPALAAGELWIGGEGVARGYHERPELTAERFVVDAKTGARFYRTGDLVRMHADGALEFLGRIDHQVKVRGHRIELGEIESALLRQPGVREAVVVARGDAGDRQLAAYVTPKAGAAPDAGKLKEALAAELPEIMVPAFVVLLPSLPLTPNGKVDRNALPAPNATSVAPVPSAPASEMETTIAGIWREVLGLPQVGLGDNFFDLGGHSLLVVQVQRRLREALGQEVAITDMFRLPTVRALAAHLAGTAPAASAVDDGLLRAQARRMMRTRGAAARAA